MTAEGVDFSFSRPGGAALVAAQKRFVVRYVPYPGDGGKGLTAAEIVDYRSHGLDIAFVWESSNNRALGGWNAGTEDAGYVVAAFAALGIPPLPVYFAVDWDAAGTQYAAIDAYLGGAGSVIGDYRVGVYGGLRTIQHCQAVGSARWFWQTYAWSGGQFAAGSHLYQYLNGQTINGSSVDLTRSEQDDYGQWRATTDVNAATQLPLYLCDIASGGTVYADETRTVVSITNWAGGKGIGLYAKPANPSASPAPLVPIRVDFGTGGSDLRVVYVGWDKVSNLRPVIPPADATPFTQADIDAAVTAQKTADAAALAAATANLATASAKISAARSALS